jgi:hypothetical protein
VTNIGFSRLAFLATLGLTVSLVSISAAQTGGNTAPAQPAATPPTAAVSAGQDTAAASAKQDTQLSQETSKPQSALSQHDLAEQQLKQQTQQRILSVIPNFNTTDNQDAAPLSPGQKMRLALRSSVDPFQFVAAAGDAGISQAQNAFPGYGQGAEGYFKRFGAAYADQFSGEMWGNAIFPIILREDPRYYRRGRGSVKSRLLWAISTAVITKNDNGTWGPNYANVLGNIAAGGLSNLYYPSTDRGVGLTFQRAFTVTAEGTLGAIFVEFWPDISRHVFHRHSGTEKPTAPQPTASNPQQAPTGD